MLRIIEEINSFPYHSPHEYQKEVGGYVLEAPLFMSIPTSTTTSGASVSHQENGNNTNKNITYFICGLIKPEFVPFFEKYEIALAIFTVHHSEKTIRFHPDLENERSITEALSQLTLQWRNHEIHPFLKKWRNELYAVYDPLGRIVFKVERVVSGLLGIRQYGCHLNGFVKEGDGGNKKSWKMWVAKRSMTKQTYPGMLDNLVGGGLSAGLSPLQVMKKESLEEAGLTEKETENLQPVGLVSFFANLEERGLVADTEFIYDLELPIDFVPKPCDGEVESFYLMDIDQVISKCKNGECMPESALVVIDFLIRHGFIHADNEPNYIDIVSSLRRFIPFPSAKFSFC